MAEHDEFGAFLIGFIVGGLTGAAVALLFAPKSGEETRTIIRDKAIELRDRASESAQTAVRQAETVASEAREKIEELAELARARVDELQKQGQVLIEEKIVKKQPAPVEKPAES